MQKLECSDFNHHIKIDIINTGKFKKIPNKKYNKNMLFYDDFIHFKGNNKSYFRLFYDKLLSWKTNYLTNIVVLNIIDEKKKYSIHLQFADVNDFNDILLKNIYRKIDEVKFIKKLHGKYKINKTKKRTGKKDVRRKKINSMGK